MKWILITVFWKKDQPWATLREDEMSQVLFECKIPFARNIRWGTFWQQMCEFSHVFHSNKKSCLYIFTSQNFLSNFGGEEILFKKFTWFDLSVNKTLNGFSKWEKVKVETYSCGVRLEDASG